MHSQTHRIVAVHIHKHSGIFILSAYFFFIFSQIVFSQKSGSFQIVAHTWTKDMLCVRVVCVYVRLI